jgi:hypothetical protein
MSLNVITGLEPVIHAVPVRLALAREALLNRHGVDGRVKPGHDGRGCDGRPRAHPPLMSFRPER